MKKQGLLFLFSFSLIAAHAQLNNRAFDIKNWNDAIGAKKIGFSLHNVNFARNTEYESKLLEGETLLGFQLLPTVQYRAFDSVQFSGGLFLKKDLGADNFDQLKPVFTVHIKQNKHQFLFGNIQGSTMHNLIEPLYAFDRVVKNRMETGIQHLFNTNKFQSDFWIDWEKMIYPQSPFREEFTAGLSTEFTAIRKNNFSWSFPVQMLVHHRGGEIDASTLPVESQFNFAYGTKLRFPVADSAIKYIELQGYLTYYEDQSRIPADSFIDGLGQYVSVLIQGKNLGFMLNYWDAHQFQSPNGDVAFQSVSTQNRNYIFNYRKMAQARLLYEKELWPNFYFVGRFNLMYDFHQKSKDMVMELYLKYAKTIGW